MGNERVGILMVAYALLIEKGERKLNFLFAYVDGKSRKGTEGSPTK